MIIKVGNVYQWGDHIVEVTRTSPSWVNMVLMYKGTRVEEQVTREHFLMHLVTEYEFYKELANL